MSFEKRVSIIVPIYKVPDYLERCVYSLTAQTHKDLEILLVDDGSPDECPGICDRLAKEDSRIRVIHKENGGLSSARNAGIAQATGDYLAFVDSDDFVTKTYIEDLLSACESSGVKLAACGYVEYYSEEKQIIHCGSNSYVTTGEAAVKDIFTMKNDIHVVAWNKLYAKELFTGNQILYPQGMLHEDVFTTYRFCAAAEKVAYINKPNYYYVQRQGSIIGQSFNPKRLQLLDAVESIKPFVAENAPTFDTEYRYYVFLNYLTILNAMADSNYQDRDLFKRMQNMIFEIAPQIKKNPYFSKKYRLVLLLLKLDMRSFYFVRKLYKHMG